MGGGGDNTALIILRNFRIYYPYIKAKLQLAKKQYRLAQWLLIETLLFSQDSKRFDHSESNLFYHCDSSNLESHNGINYTIKSLKDSFLKTGRLDSEYYQTKYEKNQIFIESCNHAKLGDLVQIKKSIEPGSEAYRESGIPFIRVSNLSPFGISPSEIYLDSKDFYQSLESLYPQKDTILLSKDGSVGIAYCVEKNLECVLSGAILRLQIKRDKKDQLLPRYLSLVLNSIFTQIQAQRDSGGSVIAHWKIEEIKNLLIPLLDSKTQEKIESKIQQSFTLRTKSKTLLEEAKVKVEQAISAN